VPGAHCDIVPEAMAAAVGAGLPVHEARGSWSSTRCGTSEVAIVSLNGIVYAASVRMGGDKFDEATTQYVPPQLRHFRSARLPQSDQD